jgi:hypothetical protein
LFNTEDGESMLKLKCYGLIMKMKRPGKEEDIYTLD